MDLISFSQRILEKKSKKHPFADFKTKFEHVKYTLFCGKTKSTLGLRIGMRERRAKAKTQFPKIVVSPKFPDLTTE